MVDVSQSGGQAGQQAQGLRNPPPPLPHTLLVAWSTGVKAACIQGQRDMWGVPAAGLVGAASIPVGSSLLPLKNWPKAHTVPYGADTSNQLSDQQRPKEESALKCFL